MSDELESREPGAGDEPVPCGDEGRAVAAGPVGDEERDSAAGPDGAESPVSGRYPVGAAGEDDASGASDAFSLPVRGGSDGDGGPAGARPFRRRPVRLRRRIALAGEAGRRPDVRALSQRELGMRGEEIAASYLGRRGWDILDRNWVCRFGEVDIVALDEDDGAVVLVEVKTRLALGDERESMPELAVDRRKRKRYRNCALAYLSEHPEVDAIRFDVIALNVVSDDQARLRHLFAAFSLED